MVTPRTVEDAVRMADELRATAASDRQFAAGAAAYGGRTTERGMPVSKRIAPAIAGRTVTVWDFCRARKCGRILFSLAEAERGTCRQCYVKQMSPAIRNAFAAFADAWQAGNTDDLYTAAAKLLPLFEKERAKVGSR
jgi:hypothetical protein